MSFVKGFWQVSDKLPKNVITACTNSCDNTDCCLSARIGTTTCAGVSDSYNKDGSMNIRNTNSYDVSLCCKTCWTHWYIQVKYGEVISMQRFLKEDLHNKEGSDV